MEMFSQWALDKYPDDWSKRQRDDPFSHPANEEASSAGVEVVLPYVTSIALRLLAQHLTVASWSWRGSENTPRTLAFGSAGSKPGLRPYGTAFWKSNCASTGPGPWGYVARSGRQTPKTIHQFVQNHPSHHPNPYPNQDQLSQANTTEVPKHSPMSLAGTSETLKKCWGSQRLSSNERWASGKVQATQDLRHLFIMMVSILVSIWNACWYFFSASTGPHHWLPRAPRWSHYSFVSLGAQESGKSRLWIDGTDHLNVKNTLHASPPPVPLSCHFQHETELMFIANFRNFMWFGNSLCAKSLSLDSGLRLASYTLYFSNNR